MAVVIVTIAIRKGDVESTPEMKQWFLDRTKRHIDLVQKYAAKIEAAFPYKYFGLVKQADNHDLSKYQEPERIPYEFISWDYRCKEFGKTPFKINNEMRERMNSATCHHCKSNRHHPEFHDASATTGIINREDRDAKPEKLIDGTGMTHIDLAEMVADHLAVAEEKGTNVLDWEKKNVNVRWKFTPEQVEEIYTIIDGVTVDKELSSALGLSRFSRLGHF
jgi:hypothetical protein